MTSPYSYTDPAGNVLQVVPGVAAAHLVAADPFDGHRTPIEVTVENLPDLVAAMYRAAGRSVPVLINPDEVADDWVRLSRTGGAA